MKTVRPASVDNRNLGEKTARICIGNAGVSVPRGQISESSSTLPSARAISEALIADLNRPSPDFTLMLMQWGQFLDHDITHTPLTRGERKNLQLG